VLPGVGVTTIRNGSILFFGVVDMASPFTKVTVINPVSGLGGIGTDGIGFDDLTIAHAVVPEPASNVLVCVSGIGLAIWRYSQYGRRRLRELRAQRLRQAVAGPTASLAGDPRAIPPGPSRMPRSAARVPDPQSLGWPPIRAWKA
jgi:hypothetical protein